jgi:hypothetical protein
MRQQPRPRRLYLRRSKQDQVTELQARIAEAAAAVEAGSRRIADYEGLVRAARARQGVLSARLADAYAELLALELAANDPASA